MLDLVDHLRSRGIRWLVQQEVFRLVSQQQEQASLQLEKQLVLGLRRQELGLALEPAPQQLVQEQTLRQQACLAQRQERLQLS